MLCPKIFTENHSACNDCIFRVICKEKSDNTLHQQTWVESDYNISFVHNE